MPEVLESGAVCYRLRRYYLWVGVPSFVFSLAMGIKSVLAAYYNVDGSFPDPKAWAWGLGIGWSCLLLPGVWLILAHFRDRLVVSDTSIWQRGCFRERRVEFADVQRVVWRNFADAKLASYPGVLLETPTCTMIIRIASRYTKDDVHHMAAAIHAAVPEQLQHGWEDFYKTKPRKEPTVTSLILSSLFLLVIGLGSLGMWWRFPIRLGPLVLAQGVLCTALGVWVALRMCRKIRNDAGPSE